MKLLNRYLITTIILSTLLVLLILGGVSIFIEMANELRSIGRGDYTLSKAIVYVLMITPNDLYLFFPMMGLIGSLVGLGLLASHSELVIMRTSGMSVMQIGQSVIVAAIILSVFMMGFGEGIVPRLNQKADIYKTRAMYGGQAIATQEGLWMHVDNGFIHVNKVLNEKRLLGVTAYEFDNSHKLLRINYAGELKFSQNQWRSDNFESTVFDDNHVSVAETKNKAWKLKLNPKVLAFGVDEPSQMSLSALVRNIHYRANIGLATGGYWVVFWQRVFQPLAAIVMVMLAIPFIFGSLRSGTMGYKIMMGIIWGLSYYLASQFFAQMSLVYNISALIGALLPIVLFAIVGFVLMKRVM